MLTLVEVFPQCRAFHDHMEYISRNELNDEFVNWVGLLFDCIAPQLTKNMPCAQVFFCTPSPKPLVFRPATESDFLDSFLRERVLSTLQDREVALGKIIDTGVSEKEKGKYVLTDQHNPLVRWQQEEALQHWGLMRKVLPHAFWETY